MQERSTQHDARPTTMTTDPPQDTPTAWEVGKTTGRNGTGHWRYWDRPEDDIRRAAESWASDIRGVAKPWLCWNMNDRWCLLQQKLILEQGWTPVVGWDPNCGAATSRLAPGARRRRHRLQRAPESPGSLPAHTTGIRVSLGRQTRVLARRHADAARQAGHSQFMVRPVGRWRNGCIQNLRRDYCRSQK